MKVEMKTRLQLLTLTILSLVLSSCCGILPCSKNSLSAEKEVTEMKEVSETVHGKNGSYVRTSHVPVTTVKTVKLSCRKCGSSFCPEPGCCGTISKAVLSRATGQGGTGEPQIGLIPTMKQLAP